ncbi:hypothetical protein [Gottfriedia acidiceleris]|uniref:Uncharacterized protein n=1 Tax=Gottfriedia acidiceleris TaxID=371036 RepID=A0ABY4JJR9_9BACI|nr:hypothetical protein [Gottfriedia acidiceleris]UPM54090.1 hypothetical protein MY490_20485 [Gottfriedia acidiceleris]
MKQIKKKTVGLILSCGIFFITFGSISALAAHTPSNSRPSVTYGSTSEFGSFEFFGPWKEKKWNYYSYAYKYHGWDKDAFEAINTQAKVTLSTSSNSTYTLSGSTEFGIKKIAEANLGGTFGKSWGKTSTVEFNSQKGYIYELWRANKIKLEKYKYTYKPLLGSKKTLYSSAKDSDGTYKWFFRYPRK